MEKHKENAVKGNEKDSPASPAVEKDALSKQLNDYRDSLQRLQAEFENYKKRVEKDKLQFRQFAAAEFVKSILPVLDSFELALKSLSNADDKLRKGMEMIYGQLYSVLESLGLRPIKAVGEMFDPYKHEVLMQEDNVDGKKDGVVAEEFQKGYMFNDAVLRCSKVKIFRFGKINGAEK